MEQVVCKNIRWDKIDFWCCGAFFPSENIKKHQEEAHSDIVKPVKQAEVCGKSKHKKLCKLGLKSCSTRQESFVTSDRIKRECSSDVSRSDTNDKNKGSDSGNISVISNTMTLDEQVVVKVNAVKKVKSTDNLKKEHDKNYLNEAKGKISEISEKEICKMSGVSVVSTSKSKHVKQVHTMNDEKIFSCEHCGKSFKQKSSLTYHNALHTGQMNFSCLFCDKKFRRKSEAKQCENKHNGIFKHSCHLCEYKTNCKWTLDRHVNFHLNIKPYSCPVCKLKSVTKSDLKYHIRKQHETDGSIISHLEATYPQMYNASESIKGWQNDPLLQNRVLPKQSTRKRKLEDQPRVEYPTIVRSIDRYSPTKKKRKLFSPKSQKSELFPEVDESGFNKTPKYSKDLSSLMKHCSKDEKEEAKGIKENKRDKHVHFANEAMTNSIVKDVHEMKNISDELQDLFDEWDNEELIQGVPPLEQVLGIPSSRYEYSVTEVNQTI